MMRTMKRTLIEGRICLRRWHRVRAQKYPVRVSACYHCGMLGDRSRDVSHMSLRMWFVKSMKLNCWRLSLTLSLRTRRSVPKLLQRSWNESGKVTLRIETCCSDNHWKWVESRASLTGWWRLLEEAAFTFFLTMLDKLPFNVDLYRLATPGKTKQCLRHRFYSWL